MRRWIADIRVKTEGMSKEQKVEYICNYYWYHILIGCVLLGLVFLLIYHVGWGDRRKEFSCVIVNQEIDFARDKEIAKGFGTFCRLDEREILVDSDYQISYEDKELEGVNESSYEKFFFNWSAGEIDAMIMPESFYEYCLKQNGEFSEERIYLRETFLKDVLRDNVEDPVLIVFPAQTGHGDKCEQFAEYVMSGTLDGRKSDNM